MLHEKYLTMTIVEQREYIAKVITLAQSEQYFDAFFFFAKSTAQDELKGNNNEIKIQLSDLDNPIENGISELQKFRYCVKPV